MYRNYASQNTFWSDFRETRRSTITGRKKKGSVLHVLGQFDFGGVESRMLLLAESQESSQFNHIFCVLGKGGAASERMQSEAHLIFQFGVATRIPSILALARLAQLLIKIRPDFVHCHGVEANFHGALISWLMKIPFACEEIGIPKHSKLARLVMRYLYSKSEVVIAVSNETRSSIIGLGEAEKSKIAVIDSPARLAKRAFIPKATTPGLSLAFVGRLEQVKNPVALVDAVGILNSEGLPCKLLVVGDGSMRDAVERRVCELGLTSSVTMLGFVPNPLDHLGLVDLFVQPSFSEGMSMALVEAMSAEIPPVITGRGGGPELVEDGVNGWILESVEPHAISRKIMEVVKLTDLELARVGQRARRTVEGRFAVASYIERLDCVYRRSVRQENSRAI